MNVAKIGAWPGLLSLDLAAMYCSMKPVEFLFQAGCTAAMVSAITGQSLLMLEHYARKRNNRKLAKAAMEKWENST